MELKKNEENTELKEVELDGMFDTPEDESLKQTISADKKNLTDDYARSGTNTSYVGGQAAEWDEKIEKNSFRMTEAQMKKSLSKSDKEKSDDKAIFLLISEVVMYLAFGFVIVSLYIASRGNKLDIIHNLDIVSLALTILTIVLIIDAALVFAIQDRKIMLLVMAFVLGIFYPIYRSTVVKGRMAAGILCTVMTIFSVLMPLVAAGQAVTRYGEAIVLTEDEFTRHAAADMMDQKTEDGKLYLTTVKNIEKGGIQGVRTDKDYTRTELSITGIGSREVNIGNSTFKNPNGLETILVFDRATDNSEFQLIDIFLDGVQLKENQRKTFWDAETK